MRIRHAIAAGATGLVLLSGAFATAASAQTEPTTSTDHPRLEALCDRIPQVQERLTHHRERILADADTFGSVAWLRARAQNATDHGRDELAAHLSERADRREARVAVIDQRLAQLDEAAADCAAAGLG
jgi:hypothetical protein